MVAADGEIQNGKTAGAGGSEGVDHAVVQGHPRQLECDHLKNGEGKIDAVEDLGRLGRFGHQLGDNGAGGLGLHQVQGAGSQGGEQGNGENQYAHAAQPVGKGAPEQQSVGQTFNGGEDGGAGGGEAGQRFKQGVDVGGKGPRFGIQQPEDAEGQGAEYADQNPDEPGGEKALPGKEVGLGPQQGQKPAHGRGDHSGEEQGAGIVTVEQGYRQRKKHTGGLHQQHLTGHPKNQLEIHGQPSASMPLSS